MDHPAIQPASPDLGDLLRRTLAELDDCVASLARHFPRPQLVPMNRGPAARHLEGRTDLLLSHLKCVRAVAALNSALVLLDHGQIQDVYVLCRIADEQQEDVVFLSMPLGENSLPSEDQIRFINEFYQEELRDDMPLLNSGQARDRVSRQTIRAALARIPLPNANPSDTAATTKLIYNMFSGFVHGAYVHIMEQFDGLRYRTRPSDHPRNDECAEALTSYVYRVCAATTIIALRCGDTPVENRLRAAMDVLVAETDCVPSDEELRQARARVKNAPGSLE